MTCHKGEVRFNSGDIPSLRETTNGTPLLPHTYDFKGPPHRMWVLLREIALSQ